MFSGLGTEGSTGSLFRNVKFQCFSVWELKVPKVPYLEMGSSNVFFCLETDGSNGSLFTNGWFQGFPV